MHQPIQKHLMRFLAIPIGMAMFICIAIVSHASSMMPEIQNSNYNPPIIGAKLDQYTAYPKRRLVIVTKQGTIRLQLFEKAAPRTVAHFIALASSHFFDSTTFHRVIPGSIIQGGDPNSKDNDLLNDGLGQPRQETIQAEFSDIHHSRGILSASHKGKAINSGTSQFFICVADVGYLDHQYTVWGQVVDGMDVVDKIANLPDVTSRSHIDAQAFGANPGKASEILKMYVEND
jgi:peptidyl-prolyl cis-trans isomerase B (cyclophilin B)